MTCPQVLPDRAPHSHPLQLAVAGYLTRYKGISRTHAESDLRAYLTWCQEHRLDPLNASRPQVELYVRWMQEVRRLKPSTVSRRMSILSARVSDRRRRFGRAISCWAAIDAATVFSPIRQPAAFSSAAIRGEP
jgi:hypothetical protein